MGSIRNKIVIFYIITLIIVISLVIFLTLRKTYNHTHEQLYANFLVSQQVLQYKLENDARALQRSLETFSKDFNTKQLISEGESDPESLTIALENHKTRVDADFVIATLKKGRNIADTSRYQLNISPEDYTRTGINFLIKENNVYLIKSSPVKFIEKSSNIDAWISMGIALEKLISTKIKRLIDSDIYILAGNMIISTTKKQKQSPNLIKTIQDTEKGFSLIKDNNKDWVTFKFSISESTRTDGVFLIDSDKAFLNYSQLAVDLSSVILITILLTRP